MNYTQCYENIHIIDLARWQPLIPVPPLSALNGLVKGHTSPAALWDQHRTPPQPQNAIDHSFHLPIESDAADAPTFLSSPPLLNLILKTFWGLQFSITPSITAVRQHETKKLLFNPFSPLVYVKPSLNVTIVFACQCGSVCSSLFSDVDSLIASEFSSLC